MSRRYGRNQRRKHRAELGELKAAVELQTAEAALQRQRVESLRATLVGELKNANDKVASLRETLEIARRVLGPKHPSFVPESLDVPWDMRRVKLPHILPILYVGPNLSDLADLQLRWTEADVMTTEVRRHEYQQEQHVIVTYDKRRWGYAITKQAMRSMPRAALVKLIADQLSVLIVDELQDRRPA